jgi:hypothetical protein
MPTYYSLYVLDLGSEAKRGHSKGGTQQRGNTRILRLMPTYCRRTIGKIQKERTQANHAIAHI